MPNRLAREMSPYLLQHANNPVDWYPWGQEALERARREDRPILLSIGYSSCHWCHVMERESFEDKETARIMNENFVCIKVDREERPDLDAIYMDAIQAITGQGGWPLTVFLNPEGRPFYGGTYFPPVRRGGMPSFTEVLNGVSRAYRERRNELEATAEEVLARIRGDQKIPHSTEEPGPLLIESAFLVLQDSFDQVHGGFGAAPKFPQPGVLELLLRIGRKKGFGQAVKMVDATLTAMAMGGIHDHLGGGFHRYSVDARWLVPHFEKMLYDNAQLATAYTYGYQATGNPLYREVAMGILDYLLKEMVHPEGGFYSSQDADTEGEEGTTYVWAKDEIVGVLGKEEGEAFCKHFGATDRGNFDGRNVLHIASPVPQATAEQNASPDRIRVWKEKFLQERGRRPQPGRDDKILVSWNGLAISALATAGMAYGEAGYVEAATRAARFILKELRREGRLFHSWREGEAKVQGMLEDYGCLAGGLMNLYEATFDPAFFAEARGLAERILKDFEDSENGGFYDTSNEHEPLLVRPKNLFDGSVPSAGSTATNLLLKLASYTGEQSYFKVAERSLKSMVDLMGRYPHGTSNWLVALDTYLNPPVELAIVGDPMSSEVQEVLSGVVRNYRPDVLFALQPPESDYSAMIPLLRDRKQIEQRPTFYLCRNFSCKMPTVDPKEILEELGTA